jgi:3'(2'), 5'-bisphosphate nucleotidase
MLGWHFSPACAILGEHGCANHNRGPERLKARLQDTWQESLQDNWQPFLDIFLEAAIAGAEAMRQVGPVLLETKSNGTPQAAADLASDAAINVTLSRHLPEIPVVSEERSVTAPVGFAKPRFILIDPIDGTREFLEGHPDHAICIALIENRHPVAGIILAPQQRKAWLAGDIAQEVSLDDDLRPIKATYRRLMLASTHADPETMVTSRSRPDPLARRMFPHLADSSIRRVGAILKLVAIARGDACIFPTSNPSSEWDIAAGEALVRAAGGTMLGKNGKRLVYGRKRRNFIHEPYIAACNAEMARKALAQWPIC